MEKQLVTASISFITFIFGIFFKSLFMNKKDKIELKRALLNESYNDVRKIEYFIQNPRDLLHDDSFGEFEYELRYICISISSSSLSLKASNYIYLPLIKSLVENKIVEDLHKLHYPKAEKFKEDYFWLFDVYNTKCQAIHKRIWFLIKINYRKIFYGL